VPIDILPISHHTGDFLELDLAPDSAELGLDPQDIAGFSAILFSGRIENTGKGSYRLDGKLHATLTELCARCLVPVTSELAAAVDEAYRPGLVATNTGLDEEGYRYEGHVIDIRQALHDNLLLSEPQRILCSPDLPGLVVQSAARTLTWGTARAGMTIQTGVTLQSIETTAAGLAGR